MPTTPTPPNTGTAPAVDSGASTIPSLGRRALLVGGSAGAVAVALGSAVRPTTAAAATLPGAVPPPEQVHLQFGGDPRTQMVVSWATPSVVTNPRVVLTGVVTTTVAAVSRTYDNVAGRVPPSTVQTWHAALDGLAPDATYTYQVTHDGAPSTVSGTFRTAPAGPAPFTFTSFGDQGSPPDPGTPTAAADPVFGTPVATYIVGQVEAVAPLLHLFNGDLCYGNIATDPVNTWARFFANNQPSAANRPWMPCPGNHENEPQGQPAASAGGYESYLTRFTLPPNGSALYQGLWYSFDVGNVRFVSLNGDDECYQDAGSSYCRGYSGGEQVRWLEGVLASARNGSAPHIDWIVVSQHQVLISSANGNGCDLGLRQAFGPLFDRYGVDLVLCGHEHDYERSYAVHGTDGANPTLLRPAVVPSATTTTTAGGDRIDSTIGTVHMVLGGGGTNVPTNVYMTSNATMTDMAKVLTGKATSATEVASWSAVRDPAYPYGFARFDVDPGAPGGQTTITATYLRSLATGTQTYDTLTLVRPRAATTAPNVLPEAASVLLPVAAAAVVGAAAVVAGRRSRGEVDA